MCAVMLEALGRAVASPAAVRLSVNARCLLNRHQPADRSCSVCSIKQRVAPKVLKLGFLFGGGGKGGGGG